jgi:hypothetical protein
MSINVKILISIIGILILMNLVSATVTFDTVRNDSLYIVKHDNSTGSTLLYSSFSNQTNLDLFTDDFSQNDYIAFGYYVCPWHTLTLNISTAISATSYGIVWQYSNSTGSIGAWENFTSADNFVDGTNNFSLTGLRNISFEVPDYFDMKPNLGTSSGDAFWIRALIVSSTSPTEGGKYWNITNRIPYQYYDYTIRISGQVTPQDIYNADVLGGWNATEHMGSYYWIKTNLLILDNTNFTTMNSTMLELGYPTIGYDNRYRKRMLYHYYPKSNLTFGEMNFLTNDTSGGSMFKYNNNFIYSSQGSNGIVGKMNLWNSIFYMENAGFNDMRMNNFDFRNSIIEKSYPYMFESTRSVLHNVIVSAQTSGNYLYIYASNVDVNNLILKKTNGILTGVTTTLFNVDFGSTKNLSVANSGYNTTCVDCYMANYTRQIPPMGQYNGVFFNTTLRIDIFNKTGSQIYNVNVTIKDVNGTTVFNGTWTNTTVINTFYRSMRTYALNYVDYDYNPFTIILQSNGLVDYRTNITINNLNKYLSITMGDYPFDINGTLVISQGKGIKIYK